MIVEIMEAEAVFRTSELISMDAISREQTKHPNDICERGILGYQISILMAKSCGKSGKKRRRLGDIVCHLCAEWLANLLGNNANKDILTQLILNI